MPIDETDAFDEADVLIAGHNARRSVSSLAVNARFDPAMFAQYVYRDAAGVSIEMTDMHLSWHTLLSKYNRLVIWSHMQAGKTTQISVLRVLWEIGNNPNIRVLILSAHAKLAQKIAGEIALYIELSKPLREVFPNLVKTRREERWQPLSGQLTVQRPSLLKDATVTAAGIGTHILGARYDLVIIDDVVTLENSRTKEARQQVIDWIAMNAQSRLTQGGRIWVVGTAWHPDDALHHYAKLFTNLVGETRAWRFPVMNKETGKPFFPKLWPLERIEVERKTLTPSNFARQYLCEARSDKDAIFKQDWIDTAIRAGADVLSIHQLERIPPGCYTVTGVDLAVSKKDSADLTAIVTILVQPNLQLPKMTLLEVVTGKLDGSDITKEVAAAAKRWGSMVFVEDNGAQAYLVQQMQIEYGGAYTIRGITTTAAKHHPEYGVQGIAAELYRGQWVFPSKGGMTNETHQLIEEMLDYTPTVHTGDRLMAMQIARQGIALGPLPVAESGYVNLLRR